MKVFWPKEFLINSFNLRFKLQGIRKDKKIIRESYKKILNEIARYKNINNYIMGLFDEEPKEVSAEEQAKIDAKREAKAKAKKLQPEDWQGNTFTISNLGMFDIEEFTAIINPPDACILAVGGIVQKPVVKNGEIVVGNTLKVTLSCDHRVVDGVVGSKFLGTLKSYLENPVLFMGANNI